MDLLAAYVLAVAFTRSNCVFVVVAVVVVFSVQNQNNKQKFRRANE